MSNDIAVPPAPAPSQGWLPLTPLAALRDLCGTVISLVVISGVVSVMGTYVIVAWTGPNSDCLAIGENASGRCMRASAASRS